MSLNHAVAAEEPKIWKTPIASDAANREMYVNSRGEPNLSGQVKLWPTPRAKESGDYQYNRGDHSKKIPTLSGAVKIYNTPTAQDAKNSTLPKSQVNRDSLVGDVLREQFATPQARDYRTGQASRWENPNRSRNLNDQVAMYPTPTTGAGLCGGTHAKECLEKMQEDGKISEKEKKSMQNGSGGQLNPDWVEWLMEFPVGWTEI